MKPGEDCVRVYFFCQVGKQVLEDEPLLSGAVGGHPQPAITEIVMHEEYVSLLEGDLVRVGHLGVWQDRHHPLFVIDGLGWRHWQGQPLVLQQVRDVSVVAN